MNTDKNLEFHERLAETISFWKNFLDSCKNTDINKQAAKEGIDFIYQLAGKKPPQIVYVDSPLACQMTLGFLTQLNKPGLDLFQFKDEKRFSTRGGFAIKEYVIKSLLKSIHDNGPRNEDYPSIWSSIKNYIGFSSRDTAYCNNIENLMRNQLYSYSGDFWNVLWNHFIKDYVNDSIRLSFRESVNNSINDSIRTTFSNSFAKLARNSVSMLVNTSFIDSLGNSLDKEILQTSITDKIMETVLETVGSSFNSDGFFAPNGNIDDYYWMAYFDFFLNIYNIQNENFNKYKKLLLSGIFEMIALEGYCFVCPLPITIHKNGSDKLHNPNGPAISWKDGFELYFWNGANAPKEIIMNPEKITREMVLAEKNAEKKRVLKEIIGNEKFVKLLDVEVIDEDIDRFKLPIKLYKSRKKDELFGDYWYFLNVICPSTKREYYISVRPCDNVWNAKAETFQNEKIMIRHGDVGLLNLDQDFEEPKFES